MKINPTKLKSAILCNHPLATLTSWKIGGPAEYFYQPFDRFDLIELFKLWPADPITFLGGATNVLINDQGVKGLVVYLRGSLNSFQEIDSDNLQVGTGIPLTNLVQKCAELGMIDATFLAGIPGTLGGALRMNAGAYGNHIWQFVKEVEIINRQGEISLKKAHQFITGYREIEGLKDQEWFVSATLSFKRGEVNAAKEKVASIIQKRQISQPLDYPSCGSVFRNPPGDYAARLIESNKLKGKQIGDAKISDKHANFIINCGKATAADVKALMQEIITTVEKNTGIRLIPEVHLLGF